MGERGTDKAGEREMMKVHSPVMGSISPSPLPLRQPNEMKGNELRLQTCGKGDKWERWRQRERERGRIIFKGHYYRYEMN